MDARRAREMSWGTRREGRGVDMVAVFPVVLCGMVEYSSNSSSSSSRISLVVSDTLILFD